MRLSLYSYAISLKAQAASLTEAGRPWSISMKLSLYLTMSVMAWVSAAEPERQQKMLSVTGVSLSVTLLATQVPMLVRLSAPITTPPSNSTAQRVVPVETYSVPM